MLRSMYSGISGMKANQTKLDVIGNNISNVGTTAFKSSRVTFSDMMSQNISEAMSPSSNQGGKNAAQVGLGTQLSSIDKVMTQGMMQPTGRSLDCAVDGDGFFMVSKGPAVYGDQLKVNHSPGTHTLEHGNSSSEMMYSRDGSFILDRDGNLLTKDGYRVMGYSVTNDDNTMPPTGKKPTPVSASGFDFQFGPGTQLNGYKIALGAIGPNTVTSATINKDEKTIIVNADLSRSGAVNSEQVSNAINKALGAEGISQQVMVSNKPNVVTGLGSDKVVGGSDATKPDNIPFLGFNMEFDEGSQLNGYTFEVNEVGAGTSTKAEVKGNVIKIDVDLTSQSPNRDSLQNAINKALSDAKIEQRVTLTGTGTTLSMLSGQASDNGLDAKAPTAKVIKNSDSPTDTFGGLTINFDKGGQLNGYEVVFGKTDAGTKTDVTLDTSKKRITLDADLNNAGLDLKDLQDKINKELDRNGKSTTHVTSITGKPNVLDVKNTLGISDGQDMTSPGKIELGGISIEVPKGSKYNGLKIEISDVRASSLSANYDAGLNKITLSGDFVTAGGVAGKDLADEINKKLGLTGDDRFFAQGSYKGIDSLNSDPIEGGEDLKSPTGETKVNGMNITLKPGGSLNGYTFQIGTITKGTKTTADVDANSKVITLNGDFTSQGAVTNDSMKSAINKALKEAGINQFVDKIEGKPNVISNTESGETNGGTPVESLTDNGALEFVSGTGTVKSYDGELKTLKIPDKVVMPGTGEELRVKTFSIDKNGLITGTLEDGRVAALGQLAMASFKNPEGLTSLGKNLYSQSVNSGDAIVKSGLGTTGEDNSSGYGDSIQGMLEMSNVDLAEQFTDMITTTRSFQASGKMINTGDEILQDIINLKR